MSSKSLPDRMKVYENIMDYSLTPGIPFIVRHFYFNCNEMETK